MRGGRGGRVKSRTQAELDLLEAGYTFTGFYTHDKQKALDRAQLERRNGKFARVLSKTYAGRIYNTVGYSVYTKDGRRSHDT